MMAGCTNVGHQEFRQVKVWYGGRLFCVSHMCGLKPPFGLYCNYFVLLLYLSVRVVANLGCHGRHRLLGRAWSVPVVCRLFFPLKDNFTSSTQNGQMVAKGDDRTP